MIPGHSEPLLALRNLQKSFDGGLCSHAIFVCAYAFLISLPSVKDEQLGAVLIGFFEWYGNFDFAGMQVCACTIRGAHI